MSSQILVDYRKGGGKTDAPQIIVDHLAKLGVKAEKADLQFGDFAFEGNGPDGTISIGVERKTLHDLLNCIDDARYAGHQRVGMKQMYTISYLLVEGHWRAHDPSGILMEGFNAGTTWGLLQIP
jgi:ERCC4-type nuclease